MKKNRKSLLVFMLFLANVMTSIASVHKEKEPWIPADFDPKNSVLLVQEFTWHRAGVGEKETAKMKEEMEKTYRYKFEIASFGDIKKGSKYDDKEKYRYALMWTQGSASTWSDGAGHVSGGEAIFHMYIYDRKLDKKNPINPQFNSFIIKVFRPAVKQIVEFLDGSKK